MEESETGTGTDSTALAPNRIDRLTTRKLCKNRYERNKLRVAKGKFLAANDRSMAVLSHSMEVLRGSELSGMNERERQSRWCVIGVVRRREEAD